MKVRMSKLSTIVILGLIVSYVAPDLCSAQEFSRKGKFEFHGIFQGKDTFTAKYTGRGEVIIDGGPNNGGFGFGYNFNDPAISEFTDVATSSTTSDTNSISHHPSSFPSS